MAVEERAASSRLTASSAGSEVRTSRTLTRPKSVIDLRSTIDNEVAKLVTFQGSEHLLRGVHLCHVLRRGAQVFGSSSGSASTYGLSRQVVRLDAFLSHNWAVGRFGKFAALAFYFNSPLSAVALLVVAAVLGPLTIAGQLPTVQETGLLHKSGVCCRLLVFPFVFLATVFSRDLFSLLHRGGPVVFLDKICIHQVDKNLQELALVKLGAFLANSETMVVAYSGLYLKKLWTVYEVASFLSLHPVGDMRIVPILQAYLFFATWIYFYFQHCLNLVARVYISLNGLLVTGIVRACASLGLCAVGRSWARERAAIQSRLTTFSVKDCVCAVESDRPIVYGNIARLMVASRRVPSDASEEVALEAFDRLVRSKMPSAFEAALGCTAFDYKQWLIVFAMDGTPACLDRLASVSTSMSLKEALAIVNYFVLWACTMWPLVALLLELCSRHFLALHGWQQCAYVVTVVVCLGVPFTLVGMLSIRLRDLAGTSTVVLAGFFLANVVGAACVWAAMTRCRRQPRELLQGTGSAFDAVRTIMQRDSVADSIGRPVGERDSDADSACSPMEEHAIIHEPVFAADIHFDTL